uniref:Pentatricopeptide repeat-containing protein n=1 Tax=Aegilops tauschii TaxID=37682 RepID=M8CAD4_AEGTA
MNLSQSLLLRPSPAGGQHGLLHLVDSCRAAAHLPTLRAVHARLLLLQHLPSSAVARVKLIQAYAACSALPAARAVLTSSPDRTTVFFNVLLRALTAASLHREALLLFASMRPQGPSCSPDHYTYPLALKSCAASGSLRLGVQIHASIARLGLDANLFVAHSAISMYARCGRPDDAYQVSAFSLGKRIHEIIKRKGMCPNMLLENALMDMYANCGCLNDARERVAMQASWMLESTILIA